MKSEYQTKQPINRESKTNGALIIPRIERYIIVFL